METAAGGVIGALIGVYVIRVGLAGNGNELIALMKEEDKYLDFLAALFALYLLHKYGPLSQLTDQLITAGVVAMIILLVKNNPGFLSGMEQFGKGEIGLLDALKRTVEGVSKGKAA